MRSRWMAAGLLLSGAAAGLAAWHLLPPRPPRVLLVGIDGADPQIVARLVGEGRLPTFARLGREGAHGRLQSREPLLSPVVWTTIVTGRRPQDHGVLDFVEIDAAGRAVPITSARRRVAALWNVAGDHGLSSGFIGWYGSFPAERVLGFQVSDRLAFHQVKSARATEGATFPAGVAEDLRSRIGEPAADLALTRRRFLDDPAAAATPDGERRLAELARIHATTELYRRALPLLADRYHPDLLGVYFELIDACGHLFMEDAPPRRPEVSEADFRAFAGTVDRCYEYQDEVLADVLRLEGRRTVTLVVSDHGFKSGDARPRTSGRADVGLAPLWHRLYGVVFVHGAGVAPGEISGAGILDVAPTALGLLSVPLSRELPGRPLRQAFRAWPEGPPPVAAYASPAPAPQPAAAAPGDSERVEQLEALGYLGGGPAGGGPVHDEGGRTAASYVNEGSALAADGEAAGALHAWERAIALDPRNVTARVFAARAHVERDELGPARALLDQALALDPKSPAVRLQRATLALRGRDLPTAEAELREARALDDHLPHVWLLQARLADAQGRTEEALAAAGRAEALTDADGLRAEILQLEADLDLRLGRLAEAEAAVAQAATLVPDERLAPARAELALRRGDPRTAVRLMEAAVRAQPERAALRRKLGESLAAAGERREAEVVLRAALEAAQDDDTREGVYGDLSLLFQQEHREEEARRILEDGVRNLPRSGALWGMLGAAHGRGGQLERAVDAYERSVALHPTALGCKTLAALVFETRGNRARAVSLWRQSLDLDARQPDVEAFLARYAAGTPRK